MGFLRDNGEDGIAHRKRLEKTRGSRKEEICIRHMQELGLIDVYQLHTGYYTGVGERRRRELRRCITSRQDMERGKGYSVNTYSKPIDAMAGEILLFQF